MNPFEKALYGAGTLTHTSRYKCSAGTVQIRFDVEGSLLREVLGLGSDYSAGEIDRRFQERGPEILPLVTRSVQIVVETDHQVSGRFRAEECPDLFEGKWPTGETFDRILRKVTERSRYPLPKPEIPGQGGKSMTAQGQTKKEGSHSHDRHK